MLDAETRKLLEDMLKHLKARDGWVDQNVDYPDYPAPYSGEGEGRALYSRIKRKLDE